MLCSVLVEVQKLGGKSLIAWMIPIWCNNWTCNCFYTTNLTPFDKLSPKLIGWKWPISSIGTRSTTKCHHQRKCKWHHLRIYCLRKQLYKNNFFIIHANSINKKKQRSALKIRIKKIKILCRKYEFMVLIWKSKHGGFDDKFCFFFLKRKSSNILRLKY